MSDKEWYVEKKRNEGSGMNINHKGLMPKCFNCNSFYKMVESDRDESPFKAEHSPGSCPFGVEAYGASDIECLVEIRRYNEKMIEKRNNAHHKP